MFRILVAAALVVFAPVQAGNSKPAVNHWEQTLSLRYGSSAVCSTPLADAFGPSLGVFDSVRWDGSFAPAPDQKLAYIRDLYASTGGKTFNYDIRKVRRATAGDIPVWSCSKDSRNCRVARGGLQNRSLQAWTSNPFLGSNRIVAQLRELGFEGFSSLYYLTSGAGNWRRGAKLVKALVPLNLAECLSRNDWNELVQLAAYVIADRNTRNSLRTRALETGASYRESLVSVESAEAEIRRLVGLGRSNPHSITPLEAKLAQVAVLSALTRRYVHFDVWTSRSTHEEIRRALVAFSKDYRTKYFFPEPELNQFVHDAIERYLAADILLGETHLFAYQEEVWPLSPNSQNPEYLRDEDANGEGAGMAYSALQTTGRLAQLKARGLQHWMFQNIEVLSMDLLSQYGAYLQLDVPVGVVVVPERDGYTGGYPYVVLDENGSYRIVLLEGVGLPEELKVKVPGSFFNSNTFISQMDLHPVVGLDFEQKNGRHGTQIVLPKLSMGFSTHTNKTGLIGGDLGWDYQDLKNLTDYERDGVAILQLFRRALSEDIRFSTTSSSSAAK